MIVKLNCPKEAEKLFGDWQETIIWSCLQNVMGAVYADRSERPASAVAVLGDFSFFAGTPNEALVSHKPEAGGRGFMIMIPQNDAWANLIIRNYGDQAKKVTRYAMKKEAKAFDGQKLAAAVNSIGPEYEIRMMDEELFHLCRSADWSKDLVSQYPDYKTYERLGLGAVALRDGDLVCGASAYSRYETGIEIEIDTKMEYRRRGLAYGCGARLILECLARGLYPSWDAQNKWSVALAEKLGYGFDHEYTAYEIFGY